MTRPSVQATDALAAAAHAGQVDKNGRAYIEHPREVALMVVRHGDEAVIVALLHDVVEDSRVTLDDLRATGYPEQVVSGVDSVTKRPGEKYFDMVSRAAADPLGRLVKLADNTHNTEPSRVELLARETALGLLPRYLKARLILLAANGHGADARVEYLERKINELRKEIR